MYNIITYKVLVVDFPDHQVFNQADWLDTWNDEQKSSDQFKVGEPIQGEKFSRSDSPTRFYLN